MGVLGLSVWHLGGWTQLQRLRRRMVKPVNASLHNKLKELADLLGINRAVELAESASVGVPTVVGWLKPVILLPASALTGLSTEQLEAILAHELAHIKRGDYLVNILQTVVEILGFYHPAVWWVSHKIRVERENCCDDLAVSIRGDRVGYARALTSMEEIRASYGLAVAATGGSLFERIRRLIGKDNANKEKVSWLPSVIAILLIMALVIPAALALSSRPEPQLADSGTGDLIRLTSVTAAEMTVEQLADICESMESAIVDVSVDYEWYVDPPMTLKDIAGTGILIDKGRQKCRLITARPFADRVWFSRSGTIMNASGDSWHTTNTSSYNGRISKQLTIGSSRRPDYTDGAVYGDRRFVPSMNLTLLGFSVLRLGFSEVADKTSLSSFLREHKELVRLDSTVTKVNGFDTIRADLLTTWNKMLFMRIYFSVDHGYTPIKYEYMRGPEVSISVVVTALQQVADGLWFPSGGITGSPDDKSSNVYSATGKIIVNKGLSDEVFDIEFPAGTKVNDEVKGTEYIVKPTEQQKQQQAKEAEQLAEFLKEHPEHTQEMERRGISFGNLFKLGGMRDIYMLSGHKELPKTLDELKSCSTGNEEIFAWLVENVTYIGYDGPLDDVDARNTPLAYDRTMLESGKGTTVLFINGMVKFIKPAQLEKLGIIAEGQSQKEDIEIRQHLSRLLHTDLPDSAGNLKYHTVSFMTTDKFLARFDMPLRDLKNLLVKSDRLPVFSELKDDPKIREKIEWYKHLGVDWWTPEDLSTAVFGHWEQGYVAPENKRVWIHSELQICCSEIEKGLMRVYIGSWSDGDLMTGKLIGSERQKGSDNTKAASQKPAVQTEDDAKAEIQVNAHLLSVPIDANEIDAFFEDESLEVASIDINDDPNLKSYFLDDEQTQQLIKLANTNPGSRTLAAPKVRVLDGEEATFRTEGKIRYEYTDPNDASGQPKEKELPIGTIIKVKPTLQADGEKILLELDLEQSNFLGFENELPQIETVRIKTNVSIPNGGTLLIGGKKITKKQDGKEP